MDQAFLLVVFDGLRPDLLGADTTPNLLRFAAMGTSFARARSVFPSETRVCSASVVTGCHPRRHGLVANRMPHPLRPGDSVDTGHKANLRALEQALGAGLLDAPTLGEILAAAGRDFVVLSSGTTGQTHVLNPRAAELGQVTLSAHGPEACSPAGARLLPGLEPAPADSVARAVWIAEVFRTRFLPAPPAATILWLCEPDTSSHYQGLGSPGNLAALRAADAAFGRILDDWQAGPQRDRLSIAVASDHGHAGITGHVDVAAALAAGGYGDCLLLPGNSGGIVVPGGEASRVTALAGWLTRQHWAGCVFAADRAELPVGVLPRSALLADHPRAAPVLFTLRASPGPTAFGLPGGTLYDGGLAVGAGTHGGLSGAELHTVLMLAGAPVRAGALSEWPAGLIDLAPTALALLGLADAGMDGRVLAEAFTDGAAPAIPAAPETWEAMEGGYAQRLSRIWLGRQVYLDAATRI